MEKSRQQDHGDDYGCDSRCVYEYVDCVESEDGASICKTREQDCFSECSL